MEKRLDAIALDEERVNEHPPTALAQRVCTHRRERTADRRPHFAGGQVQLAERFERAQPQLVEALALDQHPVVVPIGQQLAALEQKLELLRIAVARAEALEARSQLVDPADVHADTRAQLEVVPTLEHRPARANRA